jgi:RimJ/RimL family protein N-acetyltransferase
MDIRVLHSDERVTAPLIDGIPRTPDEIYAYWYWSDINRSAGLPGVMHASVTATGMFIGVFSLTSKDDRGDLDLGSRLLPTAWGQNYAAEGGAAILTHAFNVLGLARVTSTTSATNRTVPFVLAQLGFSLDGEEILFGAPAKRFSIKPQRWKELQQMPLSRRAAIEIVRGYDKA